MTIKTIVMTNFKETLLLLLIFSIGQLYASERSSLAEPLFMDEAPLELLLETDVEALINDKDKEPEYRAGILTQKLPGKETVRYEIKIRPRGGTRRFGGLCDFPPLKFNFKKNAVEGTVFAGQDKLKFVGQCQQNRDFENYVLKEYLIYKTYNLLTEESYQVRRANLTVRDANDPDHTFQLTGFFIEDDKSVTKRTGAERYDLPVYSMDSCTTASVDRLALFQYMIGNTDWYINTKHNIDVYQYPDGTMVPIPFDFDFSGAVNAYYAKPSSQIPIKKVTERYFKGYCKSPEAYNPTIQLFAEKRNEIHNLYTSFDELSKWDVKRTLGFYGEFYEMVEVPEIISMDFNQQCSQDQVQ